MAEPAPPPGFIPLSDPAPPPGFVPEQAPGMLESFGRGAAEGFTFGLDPKLGLDKERRELSRKTNPWAHFFGEVVGGTLPMAAAALLPTGVTQAAAATRAGQLAYRGAGLARSVLAPGEIGTLGQAVGQGTKLGAVYGGLSGAGHADSPDDASLLEATGTRAAGAVKGALPGALFGTLVGGAGHGVYRGAQALGSLKARAADETAGAGGGALVTAVRNLERDRITPDDMIAQIRAEFPDDTSTAAGGIANRFWGVSATGARNQRQPWLANDVEDVVRMAMQGETAPAISRALAARQTPAGSNIGGGTAPGPAAVQSLLDELAHRHLGPLNLVDRAAMVRRGSGDNTQMTMRGAAATPGEQVSIARENLLERQVGAQDRLQDLIARTVGSPDLEAAKNAHWAKLQNAGNALYRDAFNNEKPFNLAPLFMAWKAQFDKMRGVIPDTVRTRLDKMMWSETLPDGRAAQIPPQTLESFMFARQGLRDLIDELPERNNLRRHLSQLYSEMTDEVAKTNPLWKKANDVYADGMAAQKALDAGASMGLRLNAKNRENLDVFMKAQREVDATEAAKKAAEKPIRVAEEARKKGNPAAQATPEEVETFQMAKARLEAAEAKRDLFRVGLARVLSDQLANQGETHNLTKQLLLPGAQKMLKQVLGDEGDQFVKALRAEAAMHRTYASQFGSQTTPLREKVDELNWAPSYEAAWSNLGLGKILQLAQEYAARTINANRNRELMDIYTTTDPLRQLALLRAMQRIHQTRSTAGNALGLPVVGAAGPLLDAAVGSQTEMNAGRRQSEPALPPYRP